MVEMNELIKRVEDIQSQATCAGTKTGTSGIEDMEIVRTNTIELMNEFDALLLGCRRDLEKKQGDTKTKQGQILDIKKSLQEKYNDHDRLSKDNGLRFGCLAYLFLPVYFACGLVFALIGSIFKYLGLEQMANVFLLSSNYGNDIISCIVYLISPVILLFIMKAMSQKKARAKTNEKNSEIKQLEAEIKKLQNIVKEEEAKVLIEKEKYTKLSSYYRQLQSLQMNLKNRIENERTRLIAEENRLRELAVAAEARARELAKRREEEEQMRLMKALHQREVEIAKEQFDRAVISARDGAFMKEERFRDLINHTVTQFAEAIDRAGQEKKDEMELVLRFGFVVSKDKVVYDCEYMDKKKRDGDTSFIFRMHDKAELKTREECYGFAWTLMTLVGNEMRVNYPQSTIDHRLIGLTDEEKWAKTEKDPHVWLEYRGYNVHYKEEISMV